MKKFLLAAFIFFTLLSIGYSQDKIELTPTFGYHLGGKAYFYEGNIKVEDSQTYGLIISAPVDWNVRGEFAWSRADSRANFYSNRVGYDNAQFDVASNYFLLSGMKDVGNDKIKGFGGLSLGAAWFDVNSNEYRDVWNFSFSLAAGAKFYLNDLLGIRLQGRLLVPVNFWGTGFYWGSGGSGLSLNGTSSVVQGDFTAGLIIQLGKFY